MYKQYTHDHLEELTRALRDAPDLSDEEKDAILFAFEQASLRPLQAHTLDVQTRLGAWLTELDSEVMTEEQRYDIFSIVAAARQTSPPSVARLTPGVPEVRIERVHRLTEKLLSQV